MIPPLTVIVLITLLVTALVGVFWWPAMREQRADASAIERRSCRACGHPFGKDGSATRKAMRITSVRGYRVTCRRCGHTSQVIL
jgi:hypothetical protein